ncbi:hypothetical protein Tco_0882322 [Tanacetum coccineum]
MFGYSSKDKDKGELDMGWNELMKDELAKSWGGLSEEGLGDEDDEDKIDNQRIDWVDNHIAIKKEKRQALMIMEWFKEGMFRVCGRIPQGYPFLNNLDDGHVNSFLVDYATKQECLPPGISAGGIPIEDRSLRNTMCLLADQTIHLLGGVGTNSKLSACSVLYNRCTPAMIRPSFDEENQCS